MDRVRKTVIVIAALILLSVSLAGCAKNENEVLAMVRDKPIERWYYDLYVEQKLNQYQQYTGIDLTRPENAEDLAKYKKNWLEDLVGEAAALCKAEDLGFGSLTAEEEAELDNKYKTEYQQNVEAYMAKYGTDEAARRKAENEYDAWLKKNNLTTERIMKNDRDIYVVNKYFLSLNEGKEISDEEIKTEYDNLLQTQKSACDEDIGWFGDNPQVIPVYFPEGYVKVSRLQIPFKSADQTVLSQSGSAVQSAMTSLASAMAEDGEDSATAKRFQSDFDKAMTAYNNMLEKAYSNIQPLAEEADSMLKSGSTLEEAAEKLGSGITVSRSSVCEKTASIDPEMVKAIMGIGSAGESTGIVRMADGLGISVLDEFIEARTVPLEEVSGKIKDNMLAMRSVTETEMLRVQCTKEYENEIVRYLDKL
jgi:hypothetical protein